MGLSSSLQIGRLGLLASQTGIEVTGNNLSNIATKGYHRQKVTLSPTRPHEIQQGVFLGTGVQIEEVVRRIDNALETRLRTSVADQSYSEARLTLLQQIEALQNETTDLDLSTHLSEFFNTFSELANSPEDNGVRTVVLQQGQKLATFIRDLRSGLLDHRLQIDKSIDESIAAADNLFSQIASVNLELVRLEGGQGGAHSLRDERDALLGELSQYLDITIAEQSTGSVDVFVGSIPVILANQNRGVEIRERSVNGQLEVDIVTKDDQTVLTPSSGRIGALLHGREQDANNAINLLDNFASELIFQLNHVHTQGQALLGFDSITSDYRAPDPTVALNDPASGLDFLPSHGSFQIHVTQKSTGQRNTTIINVDLDGINPAADTTLISLAASINAVANVNATVTPDDRIQIDAAATDFEISFSDDSSGALAALGINTFFSGKSAADIGINNVVLQDPGNITAAQGHIKGDNRNALALSDLKNQSITQLNGLSLTEFWTRHIQDYATRTSQKQQQLEADAAVRENLESKQQAISGVNADEEAINLLLFQRAYQGSARFISVVDELLQTLISLL